MKRLLRFFRGYRAMAVFAPIFKLIEAIFELITPVVVAATVDAIESGDATAAFVWRQGGILLLLCVLGLGFSLACQYMASRSGQAFATALRRALFDRIRSLSARDLGRLTPAALVTRATSDVNQLQQGVSMAMRLLTRSPFLIAGATVGALLISPKIALIFLAAAVVIAGLLWLIMRRSAPLYREAAKRSDDIAAVTRETLSGARVIRAYRNESAQAQKARRAVDRLTRVNLTVNLVSALLHPVSLFVVNVGILAVLWWGGRLAAGGELTAGEIIALVNYLTQIQLSLVVLANLIVIFTRTSASAARVNEVLDKTPSVTYPATDPQDAFCDPYTAFSLEHVAFSYGDGAGNCLEDIDVTIPTGARIGIIGGTGSGKTTLVRLLLRAFDPTAGTVRLFGTDIATLTADTLHETIGYVPQATALLAGTIRSNLLWRKPDATDEELWRALEIAQAKDFVAACPDGLDSEMLRGGGNFSGGQRQRLTIARALVGAPRILILDDASSALDAATDRALRRALATLGVTTVVVAQRTGALSNCDKILVLDDGKICGIGTHPELLSDCPIYAEIAASQSEGGAA